MTDHILQARAKILQVTATATLTGHGECICGHKVTTVMVPLEIEGRLYVPMVDFSVLTEMFQHGIN